MYTADHRDTLDHPKDLTLRYPCCSRYQYQLPSSCETAVRTLVGLNIAVFLGWKFAPHEFMAKHFLVSLQHVRAGYIHTLVTSCFSHKDVMHLLANMFTLYFFWNRGFSGKLVCLTPGQWLRCDVLNTHLHFYFIVKHLRWNLK